MRDRRTLAPLLVLVALVAGTLAALHRRATPRGVAAGDAEKLVIISPHWEGIREEFARAFAVELAAEGRKVEVSWLTFGGTSDCVKFVRSRFTEMPSGIGVDLFFGGGVEPHLTMAKADQLDPVTLAPATLAAIPPDLAGVPLYDPGHRWYGACLTSFGVIFNRELLRRLDIPEPTSFAALGEPRARSWVALADPRLSGTVHMIYEIILQGEGWENGFRLIARMAGNARRFYHFASEVPLEIGAGEVALGTSLDSYAWSQVESLGRDSIGFIAPSGRSVINPDAIAMLRGAPNRELAKRFIEFVLSPRGQALWLLPRGVPGGPRRFALARLPIRPDVFAAHETSSIVTENPFTAPPGLTYDTALGARRWTALNGLIGTVLCDRHEELASAWRAVLEAGRPADAEEALTRPLVSEAELALVADELNAHPERRFDVFAAWSRRASQAFAEATRLARSHRPPPS